jgi:hypothetical protein
LYVNVPGEGILVFDLFGTYARTIPLKDVAGFEVRGNMLHALTPTAHLMYDMRSFAVDTLPLPKERPVLGLRVERGRTYLLDAQGITVFGR